jgi:hypothetical protein
MCFAAACRLELPEKVRLSGDSKFSFYMEDSVKPMKISDYLGLDEIRDIFDSDGDFPGEFGVYQYQYKADPPLPSDEIMTYLLSYTPVPIELELSAAAFNFNTQQEKITLASLAVPDLDKGVELPISLVTGIEADTSFPLEIADVMFKVFENPDFKEARIKEGYFTLESEDFNFTDLKIHFGNAADFVIPDERGYPLDGRTVDKDFAIYLSGSMTSKQALSGSPESAGSAKISFTPHIKKIDSLSVDASGISLGSADIPVALGDLKSWVKSVSFSKVGTLLKIETGPGPFPNDAAPYATGISLTIEDTTADSAGNKLLYKSVSGEINDKSFYTGSGGSLVLPDSDDDGDGFTVDFTTVAPTVTLTITPKIPGDLVIRDLDMDAFGQDRTLTFSAVPQPVFEWTSAVVNPEEKVSQLEEADPSKDLRHFVFPEGEGIDFSGFTEPLAEVFGDRADDIQFEDIHLYLYIKHKKTDGEGGAGYLLDNEGTKLKLAAVYTNKDGVSDTESALTGDDGIGAGDPDVPAPDFDGSSTVYANELNAQFEPIEFHQFFNDRVSQFKIKGELTLPNEVTVEPNEIFNVELEPILVFKFPMVLKLPVDQGKDYAEVDLAALMPGENGEDLFKRDNDDLDDFLNEHTRDLEAVLDVRYLNNLSLGGIRLFVDLRPDLGPGDPAKPPEEVFNISAGEHSLEPVSLGREDIKAPFRPGFKLQIPEDGTQSGFASLEIRREDSPDAGFTLKRIALSVQVGIEKTFPRVAQ